MIASMRVREKREIIYTWVFLELWLLWCAPVRSIPFDPSDQCHRHHAFHMTPSFFLPLLFCNYALRFPPCIREHMRSIEMQLHQHRTKNISLERQYITDIFVFYTWNKNFWRKNWCVLFMRKLLSRYRDNFRMHGVAGVNEKTELQRWSTVRKYWSNGFFGFSLPHIFRTYRKRWRQAF